VGDIKVWFGSKSLFQRACPVPGLLVLFMLLAILFSGCGPLAKEKIRDLQSLPQDPGYFAASAAQNKTLVDAGEQRQRFAEFRRKWFAPWHTSGNMHSPEKIYWGVDMLLKKAFFGENKQSHSREWKENLIRNSAPDSFPSLDLPGIILRTSSLRVLPTQKPAFRDFSRAGEGYPFDYMQNSAIWAGTPVRIRHVSRDGAWLLVETDWVYGWIRCFQVGMVDGEFIRAFEKKELGAVVRDRFPVRDNGGDFLLFGRVGMLLPVEKRDGRGFFCLAPAPGLNGHARLRTVFLAERDLSMAPLDLTPANMADVSGRMIKEPYGWGGMYGNRDCSALMRDIFIPFGIWLPRNSSRQAESGRIISLEDLSRREKKAAIREFGVPFATLLHMPGHVGLYLGTYNGEPLLLHNMWGVKTKGLFGNEGRHVVGKTVITTLEPGAGLSDVDESGLLINRISGMNILIPEKGANHGKNWTE